MKLNGEVTRLLSEVSAGKQGAEDALLAVVYDELHSLARGCMRGEKAGHTLQPTALVSEVYIRLTGGRAAGWEDRAHFLRVAARAMRRILVQHARRKRADKRGGGRSRELVKDSALIEHVQTPDVLELDAALSKLSVIDPRMGRVVELRFFAGLSVEETAKALEVSSATVKRDWQAAKAWLQTEIGRGNEPGDS